MSARCLHLSDTKLDPAVLWCYRPESDLIAKDDRGFIREHVIATTLYEVELKFPLQDSREIQSLLTQMGAIADRPIDQSDRYFNHPVRDFGATDEAFRIRSVGSSNCLTYKGPVLDRSTKTRHEIEVAIADGAEAYEQTFEMFTRLGFRPVREVRKIRTPWALFWKGRRFELALDVLPDLGTFLEIELVVDDIGRDPAREAILDLARELKLTRPERRSYLELVMHHDSGGSAQTVP